MIMNTNVAKTNLTFLCFALASDDGCFLGADSKSENHYSPLLEAGGGDVYNIYCEGLAGALSAESDG